MGDKSRAVEETMISVRALTKVQLRGPSYGDNSECLSFVGCIKGELHPKTTLEQVSLFKIIVFYDYHDYDRKHSICYCS